MPLDKSGSKASIGNNIRTEMDEDNKPQKQAVAIALDVARRNRAAGGQANNPSFPPWFTRIEARNMGHTGPLPGITPGRADKLSMSVPNGSHVIPADSVSAIGQGNSMAGHATLSKMFPMSTGPFGVGGQLHQAKFNAPKLPAPPKLTKGFADGGEPHHVPVMLSDGEFVISPRDVERIGGGDMEHGHRILDHFILHVRRENIKKLKSLPPPAVD